MKKINFKFNLFGKRFYFMSHTGGDDHIRFRPNLCWDMPMGCIGRITFTYPFYFSLDA